MNTLTTQIDEFAKSLAQRATASAMICLLAAPALAQIDPVPTPPGIIAWWPADGNARNIVYDNPLPDGTFFNGANASATGLVGRAFGFDGVSSYVQLPNLFPGQPEGTVECWFKLNTWDWSVAPSGRFLWSSTLNLPNPHSSTGTDGINLGCHPGYTSVGELMFGVWETPATVWHWAHSGVIPETDVWYHVAGTWGANGVCIYVNGTLSGWEPYTGPAPDYLQYNLLGCSAWPNTFTDGVIDEFSLYNRALSAEEIDGIYWAGSAGKRRLSPALNIAISGGVIVVWWPASASDFVLETSPGLGSAQRWSASTVPAITLGDQKMVQLVPHGTMLFRLRKP